LISIDGVLYDTANYQAIDCEGHGLEVLVEFDHQIFMPFIPALIGNSIIPLRASVTDTILKPTIPSAGGTCPAP
jgi:hypothetical protein